MKSQLEEGIEFEVSPLVKEVEQEVTLLAGEME